VHFTTDARAVEVTEVMESNAAGLEDGTLTKGGVGVARVAAHTKITAGERVRFWLNPESFHFFNRETGELIV
jgi:hypothetical protein